MFFEDGSYFVIVVGKAQRFEAKEWNLDARFGHVTMVAAKEPAPDERFDSGVGAIFRESCSRAWDEDGEYASQ